MLSRPVNTVEVRTLPHSIRLNDFFNCPLGGTTRPSAIGTPRPSWRRLQTHYQPSGHVRIGGSFIPVHFVGLPGGGNIPSGGAGLSYNVGGWQRPRVHHQRPGDAGDNNNNRAGSQIFYSRPTQALWTADGSSVYRDKITCRS